MSCDLVKPIYFAATKFKFTETKEGFFLHGFLISNKLNANGWMVTDEANRLDGQDFVGKPDIVFLDGQGRRSHTTGKTKEESLKNQEPFRKGTIKIVKGTDTGIKLHGISQITDQDTIDKIKKNEIQFFSPAIFPKSIADVEVIKTGPHTHMHIIHRYDALHRALVDDPAYGPEADISAVCDGDGEQCLIKLEQIQAGIGDDEIKPLKQEKLIVSKCSKTGNLIIEMEASELTEEVSRCLSKKLGPGEEPTDQDLAICFDEARKNLNSKKVDTSHIPENKSAVKLANEEVTKEDVKKLEGKLNDVAAKVELALKANTETEEEKETARKAKKAAEEEEKKEEARKAKLAEEENMTEEEKKESRKARKAAEEEEEKAQDEEKEKDMTARIASELSVKIPLVERYVAAKVAQKGLDSKASTELRETMLKASVDDIKEKLDDIQSFVGVTKSNSTESNIGYLPQEYSASTDNLDGKSTEELLVEAGIEA